MLILFAVMAVVTGIGVFLTERVDRPRRRAMQLAAETPAE